MLRWLARLLVLVLVPVVAFATTDAASAATTTGTPARFNISGPLQHGQWPAKANCSGTAALFVDGANAGARGMLSCTVSKSFDNDPSAADVNSTNVTVTLTGVLEGTESRCVLSASDSDNWLQQMSWSTPVNSLRCVPVEVCVDLYGVWDRQGMFANETLDSSAGGPYCAPITLTYPTPKPKCIYGSPVSASFGNEAGTGPYAGYHGKKVTMPFSLVPSGNNYQAENTPYRHWRFTAREYSTAGQPIANPEWLNSITTASDGNAWELPNTWRFKPIGAGNLYNSTSSPPKDPKGVWIYVVSGPTNDARPSASPALKPISSYQWGDNDPANCVFFIGTKFRDDPNSTLDDPYGPLGSNISNDPEPDLAPEDPLPPEADPGCNFSLTDPSTWASGAVCALVGLMKELIGKVGEVVTALLDLPGKIASAILDGLEGLFVPSDGFIDGKVEGLRESFDSSTMGNYFEVFRGLVPDGGANCGGPQVHIRAAGATYSGYPLSACASPMAQLSNMSRMIISVSVFLGAAFACVRILGRSMGWDPQIGGAEK